jgi:hypothetical protein
MYRLLFIDYCVINPIDRFILELIHRMHMEKTIMISIILLVGAGLPATVHADTCYSDGYEAGRNGPFSQDKFSQCGDAYEHGFMAGCLSVMGNNKEICNLAEDA